MRNRGSASLLLVVLATAACTTHGSVGDAVRGPLPTRVQHPLALTQLAFRPRRPVAQPPGPPGVAFLAAYSNIFEQASRGSTSVAFDGEVARAVVLVRQGLGAGLDVELELPFTYTSGGFLDALVESFHGLFDLPNQGREDEQTDLQDMRITDAGAAVWSQEPDRVGLADVPLVATWSGGAGGRGAVEAWRYGARLGLELPTGSEADGLGNGGLDWGGGLMAERSHGRWTHQLGAWGASIAQPEGFRRAGLELDDVWQLEYGIELRATTATSWVLQLQLRSGLVRELDLEEISAPILDLALGVVGDLGRRTRWFASFHEDLLSRSGPDFALAAGIGWNL